MWVYKGFRGSEEIQYLRERYNKLIFLSSKFKQLFSDELEIIALNCKVKQYISNATKVFIFNNF
jgi:hypothetical protein